MQTDTESDRQQQVFKININESGRVKCGNTGSKGKLV